MTEYWYLGLIAILLVYIIILYNRLIALRQTRKNSFADIDVQLKMRHNLVPNLVKVVGRYAEHENDVFTKVTEARSKAMKADSVGEKSAAESLLGGAMMNLFAVAENYPELKADNNFMELQNKLSDIENTIAAARRFFNNATAELNVATKQFPANLFAKMFGFREEAFFEIDEQHKQNVQVEF